MREPEFLPESYRMRVRGARRRRALARATVGLSLVVAVGIAVLPERAPAEVAGSTRISTNVRDSLPAPRQALPAIARAIDTLHELTPTGIAISSLTFRGGAGVTVAEIDCDADDVAARDAFVDALAGSSAFDDVRVTRAPGAIASDGRVTFHVRLDVVPAEAP